MPNPVDPRVNLPAISTGGAIAPLIPTTFSEALQMAAVFAKSTGVPNAYRNKPDDIVVAIMHGMEVGLPPLASVQNIATINGKPSLYGDAQLAVVMGSGLLEDIEETISGDGDKMEAKCRVRRRGVATEAINTFSVADARKAGLWGKQGPWTQHPKRMLKFRARSFSLRDLFADRLLGIGSAEEAQDAGIGPEGARDITPQADKPRPTSKLDALEGIIDSMAEAMPQAEGIPFKATMKFDDRTEIVEGTMALPPHDPETGEVHEGAEAEAYNRAKAAENQALDEETQKWEAWANKMIKQFDGVTDPAKIDDWLLRNRESLAHVRELNPDVAMAVIDAAEMRKRKITEEKFHQQESNDGA